MKWIKIGSAALLAVVFAGCDSLSELTELEVVNQNNPDRARAIQEAGDIESLIGGAFATWYEGSYWANPAQMLTTAADEGSLSWGNHGARQLSSEPRVAWPNQSSAAYRAATEEPWYDEYEALSSLYDALLAIEAGRDVLCADIDCDRAETFAKFVQGLAHGWLALMFDSAFVFDETIDLENDVITLQAYPAVMDAALGYLDEAIAMTNGATWTLDQGWIFGNAWTAAEFARAIHTMRMRFMTQVARTPAERAAVNWNDVITHEDAGITDDWSVDGDGADLWWHAMIWYGAQTWNRTWTRADYKTIGWAELAAGTGRCGATANIDCYQEWLATAVAARNEFNLNTPDLRIHAPGDGTVAGLDFMNRGLSGFPASRGTYHFSRYLHKRYFDYADAAGQAPSPIAVWEAGQLMKAEALIRLNRPGAAAIVNSTRVTRGGLPAAADADADIMQKMMYEYLIENFFVCPGCAYFNRRGWGPLANSQTHHWGLVEGTPLHFAMPGKEMEILQKLYYTYGGVGYEGSSLGPSAASGMGAGGTVAPARFVYAFNGMETLAEKVEHTRSRDAALNHGVAALTRH